MRLMKTGPNEISPNGSHGTSLSGRVVVTGGGGFLGTQVVDWLRRRGAGDIFVPRSDRFDLVDRESCRQVVEGADTVIHLAAKVGGIGFNRENPGSLCCDNLMRGPRLMEDARVQGVTKFVAVGTVCAYPKFTPVPFHEDDLWNGYPEETNAPYGLAKKMLLVQLQSYRNEYGFPGIYLVPVNLYGPRDNFNLERSHVIPALVRKCVEARDSRASKIVVWGTGQAAREFLYVEDAAEAIVLAAEQYDKPDPVNLGSGEEISIGDLVAQVKDLVGFTGSIEWDHTQPDGQPRRRLDTTRAQNEFGWSARTPIREGLEKTMAWFVENHEPMATGV